MEIQFTTQIFKEGRTFVAHTRELDVSSCGSSEQKAVVNLKQAVRLLCKRGLTVKHTKKKPADLSVTSYGRGLAGVSTREQQTLKL